MYKIDLQKVSIIAALVLALAALVVALNVTTAPAAPVVAPQAFQCGAGTMCVQDGGKTVNFQSGSALTITSGAAFSYPYRGDDTVTSTTTIAHGLTTTPTALLVSGQYTPTITALGATTFTVRAVTTGTVYWVAFP